MRAAYGTKPKTDFGIEVFVFSKQTGMTIKTLAENCGVKLSSLRETMTGRCAGHQIKPTVREYMSNYLSENADKREEA